MADRIRVLLTEEEVDKRINEVAAKISEDYAGKQVHMICILKGRSILYLRTGKEDDGSGVPGLYVRVQLRRRHCVQRRGQDCKRTWMSPWKARMY